MPHQRTMSFTTRRSNNITYERPVRILPSKRSTLRARKPSPPPKSSYNNSMDVKQSSSATQYGLRPEATTSKQGTPLLNVNEDRPKFRVGRTKFNWVDVTPGREVLSFGSILELLGQKKGLQGPAEDIFDCSRHDWGSKANTKPEKRPRADPVEGFKCYRDEQYSLRTSLERCHANDRLLWTEWVERLSEVEKQKYINEDEADKMLNAHSEGSSQASDSMVID